jgi:hypothetical protein
MKTAEADDKDGRTPTQSVILSDVWPPANPLGVLRATASSFDDPV